MNNFFTSLTLPKCILIGVAAFTTLLISIQAALVGLVIFMTIDLITGVKKHMYVDNIVFSFRKEFFLAMKSGGFRATYSKVGEYVYTIVMIALLESFVLGIQAINLQFRVFSITELAVCIACTIEMWSIFENREEYNKRNGLKDFGKWLIKGANILKKIKSNETE